MGREWGLNKKQGGLFMLPGAVHGFQELYTRFSLRDLVLNREFFKRADEDTVLLCAANRIYNIDFRPMIEQHEKTGASVTLLYKKIPRDREATGLFLDIGEDGMVKDIVESAKGERNCFLDCMLIERKMILGFIESFQHMGCIDMMDILSTYIRDFQIHTYRYDGYEHAVDHAKDYMRVSLDLLQPAVQAELFRQDRPILTKVQDSPPAKYLPGANVTNSIIAASCIVAGTVENSILFRDVQVGQGAVVRNSVLMQHCVISPGAVVENLICDKNVTITPEVKLSGSESRPFVIGKNLTM